MKAQKIVYDGQINAFGIAIFDDNGLMEIDIYDRKRAAEGNVYLGKIVKKLRLAEEKYGFMVEIGDGKEGLLNAYEPSLAEANMSEGQSVVVQISQEKHAEKGARLVRNLHLVGKYLVYCPFRLNIDVSKKIEDTALINKFMNLIRQNSVGQEGWIVRTIAVNADDMEIIQEMNNLRNIYENIRKKARTLSAPALLYDSENPLFEYIRRYQDTLQEVVVDSPNLAAEVKEIFSGKISQQKNGFAEYGVDEAIITALQKTVPLPHGGRLQIEETHACVSIDVDSSDLQSGGDINNLNLEAAKEIARQIRLRNLSGKIVIDFAGSTEYRFMKHIIDCLEEELADDACHSRVMGLSRAGNIEILRQRRRPTLRDLYTLECPTCGGTGRVEP